MDIELATNEELVEELMRRETFRGFVAWQAESFKGPDDQRWRWRASHCDPVQVVEEILPQLPRE